MVKSVTKLFFSVLIIAVLFGQTASVFAASLSLSPSSGIYTTGQTIAVNILLATPNQSVNAVSGKLTFNTDKLQAVTISKAGSIVQIWAAEPSFSNSEGSITYEGVIPNPGYQGPGGRILTVYFKVKTAGTKASVIFGSASALANDGLGTNVLTNFTNAEYSLEQEVVEEPSNSPLPAPVKPKPTATAKPTATTSENTTIDFENIPVTTELTTETKPKTWWTDLSSLLLDSQRSLLLVLFTLMLMLLLFLLYIWYMVRKLKQTMRAQIAHLDSDLHKAFHLLRDDLREHIETIENARASRSLTKEEERFIEHFRHNISDTEKFLERDMKSLKSRIR
ncbi:MAG: hypothetical protein M3Q73_04315 [bacterium]|nr:hypothetical protein [bacterium]